MTLFKERKVKLTSTLGAERSHRFGDRAWLVYLGVLVAGAASFFFLPSDAARGIYLTLASLASALGILWGVALHRPEHAGPWKTLAAAYLLLFVGNAVWYLDALVWHAGSRPIVVVANFFYASSIAVVAWSLLWFVRLRDLPRFAVYLIDALIIVTNAGVLSWILLMRPFLGTPGSTLTETLLAMAFPAMDVFLLLGVVALLEASARRPPSFYMLVTAVSLSFVADSAYYWVLSRQGYAIGTWIDGIWLVGYALIGAAALHPSMRGMSAAGGRGVDRLSRGRIAWFAIAALVAPASIGIEFLVAREVDLEVVVGGSVVLFLLMLTRFAGAVRSLEAKSAELERSLEEQHRSQERLRAAEQRHRSLVEQLPVLVYMADVELGKPLLYVGPQWERLTGYSAEDFERYPDLGVTMIHPEDRDAVVEEYQRCIAELRPFIAEFRMITRDAHVLWVRNHAVVVGGKDGERPYVHGVVIDMTQQKEADQALRAAEARYRTLVEQVPAVAYIEAIDDNGSVLYVSPRIEGLVGYTAEDWTAQEGFWLRIMHPDDVERVRASHLDSNVDPTSWVCEYRLVHSDGHVVWVRDECAALRDEDGTPRFWQGLLIDISESKRAEEERALLQEQLRQSQKMEAIGQLAGGIAHDFNNILAVIQNCATFLTEELEEGTTSYEDAQEIQRSGARAARLVRQLLAFSRRDVVDPVVVDLNDVIRDMDGLMRRSVRADIELAYDLDLHLPPVHIDPGQVEQILVNLALNARDAMPDGGRVVVSTESILLDDHATLPPGEYVRLAVTDSGLGMSPEIAARIFEPFFTTKEHGAGSGLGLATVYGIVAQAGGCIEVETAPGRGASFVVHLPATDDPVARNAAPARAPQASESSGLTVLLAEDEDALRRVAERILVRNGYRVLRASCGEEALRIAAFHEGHIDMLVTDVVMPQISGTELAARLAKVRDGFGTVFMSGYSEESLTDLTGPGAASFLQKPFTSAELLEALENARPRRVVV